MKTQNSNLVRPPVRMGETEEKIPFRVDRLFSIGTDWYFSTREGIDQGPFSSRKAAEEEITKYINDIESVVVEEIQPPTDLVITLV